MPFYCRAKNWVIIQSDIKIFHILSKAIYILDSIQSEHLRIKDFAQRLNSGRLASVMLEPMTKSCTLTIRLQLAYY